MLGVESMQWRGAATCGAVEGEVEEMGGIERDMTPSLVSASMVWRRASRVRWGESERRAMQLGFDGCGRR
jgi:hypothetical protein